jgi:cell division protein FtsB
MDNKKITPRARMKKLVSNLRYAQMHVRLDLYGLKNSKEEVRRISKQMIIVQKEMIK